MGGRMRGARCECCGAEPKLAIRRPRFDLESRARAGGKELPERWV